MSKIFRVTLNGQTPKEVKHIYLDDTIDTVKRKIVHEYENSIGYDAIYIFVTQEKSFVPEILYNKKNGARIQWYRRGKMIGRFLSAPFRRRQVVD